MSFQKPLQCRYCSERFDVFTDKAKHEAQCPFKETWAKEELAKYNDGETYSYLLAKEQEAIEKRKGGCGKCQ